ncbi:MAG: phosphoribosylamine--glycine ligase [Patescibacteria group bacterium]
MKILIIGNGGREHALVWKISQHKKVKQIFIAPGNAGTVQLGENVDLAVDDLAGLLKFAQKKQIDLTVVGPEDPLSGGIVDLFEKAGLSIFGPSKRATQLESSKVFAKKFMQQNQIPTAKFEVFNNYDGANKHVIKRALPLVIKVDGLAAGKGVFVCQTLKQARQALASIFKQQKFGLAGTQVVIEDCLFGQEASIICLTDGQTILPLLPAQDHKALLEDDQGPNTGGMGAYAPAPVVNSQMMKQVLQTILKPTLVGLKRMGITYRGILYAGIMLTPDGPQVLEYNARFGDPETQPQLMLLKSDLVNLINSCLEGTLKKHQLDWYPGFATSVVMVSGGYPEKYQKNYQIKGLDQITDKSVQVFLAGAKNQNGKIVTDGGRVLAVTARAKTLSASIQLAYQNVAKIDFKQKYFRSDIGARALRSTNVSPAVHQIQIKSTGEEARARVILDRFSGLGLEQVQLVDVYTIDKDLTGQQLKQTAMALSNQVIREFKIDDNFANLSFDWAVEIGFKPGVKDNLADTAKESIEDLLKSTFDDQESVYSSKVLLMTGQLSRDEMQNIAQTLANLLIQSIQIKSWAEFKQDEGMDKVVPQVKLMGIPQVDKVDLNVSSAKLKMIGSQGIANTDGTRRGPLALDLAFLKAIRLYFRHEGRQPTDIELEMLAQTWSEHCKHTIMADAIDDLEDGLYKSYIQKATQEIRASKGEADICMSVFTDNSGAIIFDDEYLITDKVETHNSPSALDPFGGSITGIVGVNRDTIGFGLGAKPILNRYGFCFADPRQKRQLYKKSDLTGKVLDPAQIIEGVVRGVNAGGNQSGIPTTQGFVHFQANYQAKPLVFVGTVGLIPRQKNGRMLHQKQAQPGDLIVVVGGRVGLDGIHGATFSSQSLNAHSPVGAVQIGDPITQKKMSDTLIKEARDRGLYNSLTDNGAGGLSCSVAEMAKESDGCLVNLNLVPLKYPGLAPWQIWISESQERMTLAVPPAKWAEFSALMQSRGVEATVIGEFTDTGRCRVEFGGEQVVDLDMKFLHDGLPSRPMQSHFRQQKWPQPQLPQLDDLTIILEQMLNRPNLASFASISSQYDHEVQAGSVIKPLQGRGLVNGDATVIRPVLTSNKGIVVSQGMYPEYGLIDTYHMAGAAIDTAIRSAIVVGGDLDQLALLDNFCWCSARDPHRLGQLKRAAQACYDYATAFGTPFISGKDSMFNDFEGFDAQGQPQKISILPTLLISSVGVVSDATKTVSMEPKFADDLIYVLGETFDEVGGSEYLRLWGDRHQKEYVGNQVPQVDAGKNVKLYRALTRAIKQEIVASCMSLNQGGLGVALAKMALAGGLGIDVSLKDLPGKFSRSDYALFSESQGRVVVTIDPQHKLAFEKIMAGQKIAGLGKVIPESKLVIKDQSDKKIVKLDLEVAGQAYSTAFNDLCANKVRAVVVTGYGINCEEETAHALELAGARAEIIHVNDLIDGSHHLSDYQVMVIPGGFSYGDETGSGQAMANRIKNHLLEQVTEFVAQDKLVLGICNGFQVLVNLGLLPDNQINGFQNKIALTHNDSALYTVRWVDLKVNNHSPWLKGLTNISLPIAHGEGKFVASSDVLTQLKENHQVALSYTQGEMCQYQNLAPNPNGSLENVAGITDPSGRILGLMPHPERAIFFTHLPNWQKKKEELKRAGLALPKHGPGLRIFTNGVKYIKGK